MLYAIKQWTAKRVWFTLLLLFCSAGFAQSSLADDSAVAVVDNTKRVIGGDISSNGQFPYMAGLVRNSSAFLTDRQFCGASIINEKWLVTAAHCMYDFLGGTISNDSFRAVVGVTNLRTESPTEYVVANYFIHPQYDNEDFSALNDIALIELANILPEPAISLYSQDADALAEYQATVIGWGAVDYSDPSRPIYTNELRHAVVPLVSRDICNAPVSYAGNVADSQICAGFALGGTDSCVGDSGGPLVTNIDGVQALVGIVSYGRGCAEPLFYGVYTNVGSYVDWISQYTRISTVDTPRTLIAGGGTTSGGSAGSSGSTGGAAWMLLWIMAGLLLRRRS